MKISIPFLSTFGAWVAMVAVASAAELPTWAFPQAPPPPPRPPAAPGTPPAARPPASPPRILRVPDSTIEYTRQQLGRGRGAVPDWHPGDHPEIPNIVKFGREPQVWACGYCHLPTGAGRPENASISGLSAPYIKQQVLAFKHGERPGSEPKRGPQNNMILLVKDITDAEIDEAAAYFAALKPQSYMKVVETDTVPKTIVVGAILAKAPEGGTEPIGNRIIEVPDDLERFENRDSRVPYEVYVPIGSLKRGAELANTGAGKTQQCMTCHGPGLKGLGDVPRLAGRSPSYLMRQLYDVKHGGRVGASTALMKVVVANLDNDDMLALSAYMASLEP